MHEGRRMCFKAFSFLSMDRSYLQGLDGSRSLHVASHPRWPCSTHACSSVS